LNKKELLPKISRQWDLELARWREDLPLAGSPERTTWRCVVETADDRLFVLEKIASRDYGRKRQIAAALEKLKRNGLEQIAPYLPDKSGETIPLVAHGLWQLSPFVPGVDLRRPEYAGERWRGGVAADFLIRLDEVSSSCFSKSRAATFSLPAYIRNLMATLSSNRPDIAQTYRPFREHLEEKLFPIIDRLPVAFCHGDYHPLNIIWGEHTIRAVIDWEFCGFKPEMYDLANLAGCLGMEDPHSISGSFVEQLAGKLKRSGTFAEFSWRTLPDLILAIRFAWLSEWLRKNDRPMIRMEADYMALLLEELGGLLAF
jgi:homoserine kinase type II